jgi:hypothetical protein
MKDLLARAEAWPAEMANPADMIDELVDGLKNAEHVIAVLVDNLGRGVNPETSNAYLKYVQKYGIPERRPEHGTTTDSEGATEP